MANEVKHNLKSYRAAVRAAWLPLVDRKKLSSHEYELTAEWFNSDIPIRIVLRAIDQVKQRARSKGTPLYSLGIIKPDLITLGMQNARSQVGRTQVTTKSDWRASWATGLDDLAINVPDKAAKYRELKEALPSLTLEEAQERLSEIR
jgi:hypothetical protein